MSAALSFHPHLVVPSFKQLCVLAHHAYERLGADADRGEVVEELKWACAALRFDYRGDGIRAAVEAVYIARQKGYRTPGHGESLRVGPNRYVPPPAFTRDELNAAAGWLRAIGGCPHDPGCVDHGRCLALAARTIRERRKRGGAA